MRRLPTTVLLAAVLAVVALGCSSSSSSTATSGASGGGSTATTYPAGKEQACQARDKLKTSLAALTNPSLLTGGASGIKSAIDTVQTDLNNLARASKQDYKPQVDALQSALKQLQTAVGNLGNGNGVQNLQAVGTQIGNVGSAAGDLLSQLQAACGS